MRLKFLLAALSVSLLLAYSTHSDKREGKIFIFFNSIPFFHFFFRFLKLQPKNGKMSSHLLIFTIRKKTNSSTEVIRWEWKGNWRQPLRRNFFTDRDVKFCNQKLFFFRKTRQLRLPWKFVTRVRLFDLKHVRKRLRFSLQKHKFSLQF